MAVDIGQFTAPLTVLGVPEITIRFGDQPERLTGLGIQSYSWLRFVAERIQNKISPKKPHEAKSRGNKLFRHKFSRFPNLVELHRTCFLSSASNCDSTCDVLSTREAHQRLWKLVLIFPGLHPMHLFPLLILLCSFTVIKYTVFP